MIRGFFYKFNRSFKNLKNVIFHVKLLSPTLRSNEIDEFFIKVAFEKANLKSKKTISCSTEKYWTTQWGNNED